MLACDEVLFASVDEPHVIAVVHLTCANRPEPDPRWPTTTIFASLLDWAERGAKRDHEELANQSAPIN